MKTMSSVPLFVGFLFLVFSDQTCEAHRILGLFPLNAKSHFMLFEQLMKGLVERGHQVDLVSHFPLKETSKNYTYIGLEGTTPTTMNNVSYEFMKSLRAQSSKELFKLIGDDICELLAHPKLQNLIKHPPSDPPYDVIVMEISAFQCYLAFGRHLKVPVVGITTTEISPWMGASMGNPDNYIFSPMIFTSYNDRVNFWQRLGNTLLGLYFKIQFYRKTEHQREYVEKYINPELPGIRELERDFGALILSNSHHSLNGIKAFNPSIVEVGGLHLRDDGLKLSPEMKKWLDDSKYGFIYFSLGSMVRIESFPTNILAEIYSALKKIEPIRVLMKVVKKEELPPGLPENVMTAPWVPQFQVLQHKNLRAFITHGGLMSIQEAVFHAVPIIGIPLFADQPFNIQNCVAKKIGVSLDYNSITEESLTVAINTVVRDPSYKKNMDRLSRLFRDRPISPLDLAIYSVEYVIRNGYALKAPSAELMWWQISSIDIHGFLFLCILVTLFIAQWIFTSLYRLTFNGEGSKSGTSSKKVVSKSKKIK